MLIDEFRCLPFVGGCGNGGHRASYCGFWIGLGLFREIARNNRFCVNGDSAHLVNGDSAHLALHSHTQS